MALGDDRTARPRRGERLDHRAHRLGRNAFAAHARREPVTYLIFTAQAAMDADDAVEVEPAGIAHRMEHVAASRSEEHTSELQSLMRISYAVFCLKKKTK